MSVDWAERQRQTNQLARKLARHLFSQHNVTAKQLYGLSKLAWITNSFDCEMATYISSTKIPALGDIFVTDFSNKPLADVAERVSLMLGDSSLQTLITGHTGFSNFYKAYRNSVLKWIEENLDTLLPLYMRAYSPSGDDERLKIVEAISKLPGVPKANHPEQLMRPEYFLTPAFFILDPEVRFPLINGNKGVQNLLKKLNVAGSDLVSQYRAMTGLYGIGGIRDAADLDQIGDDLSDFVTSEINVATKKLLEEKNTISESALPFKDEKDIESIRMAGTVNQRKIHNKLTNMLRYSLSKFTLLEGNSDACMFDVLVKRYNSKEKDLLIEVKSSIETAHIRMAVGQLFHYWYELNQGIEPHVAILLPEKPSEDNESFLKWMKVGILWYEGEQLCTSDHWLQCIAQKAK
jgi:hypothetical protein